MTFRLNDIEEFEALQKRLKSPLGSAVISSIPVYQQKSTNKHRNVICEADNLKFPSKKHRKHYLLLRAMQTAGVIKFFLREVPFDLPGHYENGRIVRHYVDFMVVYQDMTVKFQEVKGRDLSHGRLKRIQTEELYGIKIEVI